MGGLGELFLHERPGPRRPWGLAAEAQSGFSAVAALSSLPRPQQGVCTSACACSVWLPPADLAVLCASPCALGKQPRGSAWGRRLLVAPCCSHAAPLRSSGQQGAGARP